MKTILSNRSWFNNYCVLRTISILGVIVLGLIYGLDWLNYQKWWGAAFMLSIGISILLMILLFDFLQEPAFIELILDGKELIVKQYVPDRRYFYFLKEQAIHQFKIPPTEKLTFSIQKGVVSLFDKIIFQTNSAKSIPINCAWLSLEQLNFLENQLRTFNKELINY